MIIGLFSVYHAYSQMVNVNSLMLVRNLIVAKTLFSSTPTVPVEPRAKTLLLLGISFGYFIVLLDTTVVTVALPAISHDLGAGLSGLQWVVNAYTLVFASLLLTAGALADQFGARRIFLIGLVVFLAASAISAAVPSLGILIGLRVLLGVGGAMLLPPSLTLITHTFHDPASRARATGVWAAISGGALAAGPVLGGILVDTLGWRSIFLLNVPIALISFILTMRLSRETSPRRRRGFDLAGQVTIILAIAALTFALIEGEPLGWRSSLILASFGIAILCAFLFLFLETRGRAPMLPLRLFTSATISTGMVAGFMINIGLSGSLFMLSLFFQQARGYSALSAGLAFLPLTLPTAFNPILTGRLVGRIGAKVPMTTGFFLAALGTLIQAWVSADTSYAVTFIGLLFLGFGVSLAIPSLVTIVMSTAPKELAGTASGALNSSRQLGAVIGVALLGTILNGYGTFIEGLHVAFIITSIILFGGALLVLMFIRHNSAS